MAERRRQSRETGRDRFRSAGSRSRSRSPLRERERPKEKNVDEGKTIDREKVRLNLYFIAVAFSNVTRDALLSIH